MKKAVMKHREYEKHKAAKKQAQGASATPSGSAETPNGTRTGTPVEERNYTPIKNGHDREKDSLSDIDVTANVSEDDMPPSKESETPFTPINQNGESLKRKRNRNDEVDTPIEECGTPNKRARSDTPPSPPPPPPPPPPISEETSPINTTSAIVSPTSNENKRKRIYTVHNEFEVDEEDRLTNGAFPLKRARSITPSK